MQIKSSLHRIRGMNKDSSYSTFSPEFSWENKNIRITAIDNNNLLSITNEKGNKLLSIIDKTPTKVINYTYNYEFDNFLNEQAPTVYTYSAAFSNFMVEQSDGWTPPVQYTYSYSFDNYLVEQTNI